MTRAIGIGIGMPFGGPPLGSASYSAEATAYFAAMSVEPSTALKDLVEDLITTLKADGVWTLIDWLGLGPMHDAQAARVNLVNPAQVASAVNSPIFTEKQGYAGDNATAYLDSGIVGSSLTDTDTSLFVRIRTVAANKAVAGYSNTNHRLFHGNGIAPNVRLVGNSASSVGTTLGASGQFVCGSRTGTTMTMQVGTAVEDTDTISTATGGNTATIKFLSDGTSFSGAQLSYWGFGKHLDNTNATALRACLLTFITAAEAL